ncbi:hypothetical protein [Massilia psychrophila]|uniref:hypothetical protein n=1 Tax=Massilia psychrophila TaxID=1603353 RepID=UPI0019AF8E5F|nr:hypothetical protein [Massilia psychrophila]GGE66519.1 hypothetical protein GCM10008020_08560 [Massilia psychrophila]
MTSSTTSGIVCAYSGSKVAASATVLAPNLNLPAVTISGAEARAEAVEFVKHYKTALAVQLDQYKN